MGLLSLSPFQGQPSNLPEDSMLVLSQPCAQRGHCTLLGLEAIWTPHLPLPPLDLAAKDSDRWFQVGRELGLPRPSGCCTSVTGKLITILLRA